MDTNHTCVLHSSRRQTLVLLAGSSAFTAAGIWMLTEGHWRNGSLAAGFCGLGVIVFAVQLLPNSSSLRLSPNGFEVRSLFRSSTTRWCDIDRFAVGYVGHNKMVVFNFVSDYPRAARLRGIATALCGWEGALPDTYGMSANKLADFLNRYKETIGE